MAKTKQKREQTRIEFGDALAVDYLAGLAAELQQLRDYPPLVRRADGKYEGGILGFVKGLRLSARVVYFLRQRLADTRCEIHWGHLLDTEERSCSPECDVIIHDGSRRRWNGFERPVMDFAFVVADKARAVVSCKSKLDSIDAEYPKALRRFGVKDVLLFAECCDEKKFERLRRLAKRAGYRGLWCLYFTGDNGSFVRMDTAMYVDFANAIAKTIKR